MLNSILPISRRNLSYAKSLLQGIGPGQMADQPAGLNHPAWIIGHIACSLNIPLRLLAAPTALPEPWEKLFGWGSAPAPNLALYPSGADLLAALETQHEQAALAVSRATPADLAKPVEDEHLRQFLPTVAAAVCSILLNHEAIHLGQLSAWRLAKGLPLPF